MKVYLIIEHFDNGESYEDHFWYDNTNEICGTYEKAKEIIDNYPLPEMRKSDEYPWLDGYIPSDDDFTIENAVRHIYQKHDYDEECQEKWWEIEEREVIG